MLLVPIHGNSDDTKPAHVDEMNAPSSSDRKRNNNIDVHIGNNLYKTDCVICGVESMVPFQHYTKQHPDSEVFIARMKPDVATKVYESNSYHSLGPTPMCLICGRKINHMRTYIEHFASHIGLVVYKCRTCNESASYVSYHKTKCANADMEQIELPGGEDTLLVFACKMCNYVHMLETKMVDHLKQEHDLLDENEIKENIVTVVAYEMKRVHNNNNSSRVASGTTSAEVEGPPNTNADVHIANVAFKNECVICGVEVTKIFLHYIKHHRHSEVFVSRMPPHVAEKVFSGHREIDREPNCLICDRPQQSMRSCYEHMASHMGLFVYECRKCGASVNHSSNHRARCEGAELRQIKLAIEDDTLYAFACKKCNFIHLLEKKIIRHLEKEHQMMDDDEINECVFKVSVFETSRSVGVSVMTEERRKRGMGGDGAFEFPVLKKFRRSEPIVREIRDIKNDNVDMYLTNPIYRNECALCGAKHQFLVNHYVKCHPEKEVCILLFSSHELIFMHSFRFISYRCIYRVYQQQHVKNSKETS